MIQLETIRTYAGMLLEVKQDIKKRGGSDEEARSAEITKITIDGTKLNGDGQVEFDHNKKQMVGLINTNNLTDSYKIISSDSQKELLETITATHAIITSESNFIQGSISVRTTSVCYLRNENSLSVATQMSFAYLISIIVGNVCVCKVMDNASWNNKYLTANQRFPQQYSGQQHNDVQRPTDRRYNCFDKSPFYSNPSLYATSLWVPFLYFLMDVVHAVFKTPRNHLLNKPIALYSPRRNGLIIFCWELLKAFVLWYEMNINRGVRLVPRLDLASIFSVDDNNANKMSVKTATATTSEKMQEYLTIITDGWLLPEMNTNGDFILPFQVENKDVMASALLDTIDGFLDYAKVYNRGIDSLNGERSDGYGGKKNLYINYEDGNELTNIREISRKIDDLGRQVCATEGLTLGENHWPSGTAAAIGICCHGIASFITYITKLIPLYLCVRMLNADDNEVTFAATKARAKILTQKSFNVGLSVLTAHRIKKLSLAIKSQFKLKNNKNKKRDRFSVISYSRNTNSTIVDDDINDSINEYSNENNINDEDIDSTINDGNDSTKIEIKFKRRNKARKLKGSTENSLDNNLTGANRFSRSANISKMAADNMTIDKLKM